jgi:hypothetical protein
MGMEPGIPGMAKVRNRVVSPEIWKSIKGRGFCRRINTEGGKTRRYHGI